MIFVLITRQQSRTKILMDILLLLPTNYYSTPCYAL